ncbi:MAG: hypothetical protein GX295_01180 [Syntrophomonadaceae bacterium]|nr:hypothetical protein [Syntrophomonadaceae bacterium]
MFTYKEVIKSLVNVAEAAGLEVYRVQIENLVSWHYYKATADFQLITNG